jgi:predicted anti-sigma-YlaC factor YlaD
MRCKKIRARIQQWFDAPGISTMSPEIAAHVRECGECRALITRWNAIELQIQSMKTDCPEISPDFAVSLRERLRNPDSHRVRQPFYMPWRMIAVGATCVLMLIGLLYTLGGPKLFSSPTQEPPLAIQHTFHGPVSSDFGGQPQQPNDK